MALDAHVSCDCFERGRLRSPPPPGSHPAVDEDGGLLCGSDDLDIQIAFDVWLRSEACEHENGRLVDHRIGNISLVAVLRAELGRWPERFPIFLRRVVYDGTHCGDFIPTAEMAGLAFEVAALAEVHCLDESREQLIRGFESQMKELVVAALQVGKPLVF